MDAARENTGSSFGFGAIYLQILLRGDFMTALVVVRKNGKAAIAADSQTNQGGTIVPADVVFSESKFVRLGDSWAAFSGSCTHQLVMTSLYARHPDKFDLSSRQSIFETFLELHEPLQSEFFVNTSEDGDQPYESNQLWGMICNSSGVYNFQSYREVKEIATFWASGSGADIALGALHVLYEQFDDAEEIARRAVEAACKFDDSCGLPVESYSVDLK